MFERAVNCRANRNKNQRTPIESMKLSLKNPKQAKSCSLVVTTIALAAMADSNAATDNARVFNKTVSKCVRGQSSDHYFRGSQRHDRGNRRSRRHIARSVE